MEDKHPAESRPIDWASLRQVHASSAHQPEIEKMVKGIKSFPKGSGGGASGLRPQHLKDALVPGFANEILRNIVGLVQLLARGEAPVAIQPYVCGASLAALPKDDGIHRPIAAGETWRRLVSKTLEEFEK